MVDLETASAASQPVAVVDFRPARIRRPLDVVRLFGLLAALLVVTGLGALAGDTGREASEDLARLVRQAPSGVIRGFGVLGALSALGVPLALMTAEIVRGYLRRLIESLITGLAAIGLVEGLNWWLASFPSSSRYAGLTGGGVRGAVLPLDTYLAALLAFLTVTAVPRSPRWRGPVVAMTVLYVASTFAGTEASLLSLLASMTIGAMVGVLVRLIAGQPNGQPDGSRIAEELDRRGITLARLERIRETGQDHRTYRATTGAGGILTVHVFDRDLISSGALSALYRMIRFRRDIAPPPILSLERAAERRALLAMAATTADVPVPRLVAGVPCGPDTIVLAYQAASGTALHALTDQQLGALWSCVARLHRSRVTHHGLTAEEILVDPNGQILLPVPADGTAFATELRISLDRAELLVSCAQLAGPERAVRSALTVVSADELAATLPLLQPIALSRKTREALKQDPRLLETLREAVLGQTHRQMPELARVERVRPRTIISIAAAIVAGYLVMGQVGGANLASVLAQARWRWVPLLLVASGATYLAAALCLIGAVHEKLSFARTVLVQLATAFAGFVTPRRQWAASRSTSATCARPS